MRCFVVPAVHFFAHDCEVTLGSLQQIGLEGEIDRWDADCGFELCRGLEAFEAVLPHRVFVLNRLAGRGEHQPEIQKCRIGFRIHGGPTRLVDDGQVRHLERGRFSVRGEGKSG